VEHPPLAGSNFNPPPYFGGLILEILNMYGCLPRRSKDRTGWLIRLRRIAFLELEQKLLI